MNAPKLAPRTALRVLAVTAVATSVGAATAVAQTTATTTAKRPATAPAGVVCASPPAYGPGGGLGAQYGIDGGGAGQKGNPAKVTLSRNQLLINQRISQTAIRRVEAVQKWLDAGILGTDICGGALWANNLGNATLSMDGSTAARKAPTPRAFDIGQIGGGDASKVTLSRDQLLINQRISQEAVRRANALKARLSGNLTGGDIKDGTIVANNLRVGMRLRSMTPVTPAPSKSLTVLAPKGSGNEAGVKLSSGQLLINQRISQAAVRRANGLMAHIRTGLNGSDFKANAITSVDIASGVFQP